MPTACTDTIRKLGTLGLASRLRRLSDRLYGDAARIYRESNLPMEPRWFPLLVLLDEEGETTVTGAADRLAMTHPAVHQIAAAAARKGLIRSRRDRRDERRRLMALTARGKRAVDAHRPFRARIRCGVEEMLREAGVDLLGDLEKVERALDGAEIRDRIAGRGNGPGVEIVDYRPAYKKHFRRLNMEWLEKHFSVEPEDARVLDDPNGRILRKGGEVLFARRGGEIVGTAALLRVDGETFEIAKMAVGADWRRRGIGRALAREAIERARRRGAVRVVLHTSPRLREAIRLYRSLGFVRTGGLGQNRERFERPTVRMVLSLKEVSPASRRTDSRKRKPLKEREE